MSLVNKIIAIFLFIGLLAGCFYWFQWRPTEIRKECSQWIVDLPGKVEEELQYASRAEEYNNLYKKCLHEKGLK